MTRRGVILWGALVATLIATFWAARLDDEAAPRVADIAVPRGAGSDASTRPRVAAAQTVELHVRREAWPAWAAGILQPMRFAPQAPPAVPLAASEPSAPPLPFRYVGAIEEGGARAVILTEGDAVHIVRVRERIGERYRIERISATEIEFTYLPLMQRQRLGTSRHEQYQ